jgi:ATP-dependent helicase/nuclease subunit B
MLERVFLGWDRPFLMRAADWLLDRRDELPGWLVVVPTSQAGRALRTAMAERAGALLSPGFTTPGALLKTPDPEVAEDWVEHVAWMETLENIPDWSIYQDLFPEPPGRDGQWSAGLATEMVKLRHTLQENGHTLASAARFLSASVEAERWDALGRLESIMEQTLRAWGRKSRSRVLAAGVPIPHGITGIVLAGVTEMPPLVERALAAWNGPVSVLIGAPEAESGNFSQSGRPLACWTERIMPWPEGSTGSVTLVADPRQEAVEAMRVVAEMKTPSSELALGTADSENGGEIAGIFTRAGWTAYHPAAAPLTTGLARWLKLWSAWLGDPSFAVLTDMTALPETGLLTGGSRAKLTESLSRLRNDWMITRPDDLRHRMHAANYRSDAQRISAEWVLAAVEVLETWRRDFLTEDFTSAMEKLLGVLGCAGEENRSQAGTMLDWLDAAAGMMRMLDRQPSFWIDLMLENVPCPAPQPPDGRVIDVQGWLELFFEPGRHLVLCGMNEGKVPARNTGDPWLGEAAAKQLGLIGNTDRAARDAFLYQAMLEARHEEGRVDVICAKSGSGGESLQPSRLLLAAAREDLPERVKFLFRGIEPPEAGLRWHADWKWQPRGVPIPERLAVTSLGTYLACPFRFYLKYALRMQTPEPTRLEWNARDFGNIAHDVLERWGRDTEARDLSKSEALADWFSAELDRVVVENFGKRIPLAVRIQTEALRQRFNWLARAQANSHEAGWEVMEVEQEFQIPIGDTTIIARIDRIDRNRENGQLRVLDYKTGKIIPPETAHRKKTSTRTSLPEHLGANSPALFSAVDNKGKPAEFRWTNLQLPLYVAAVEAREKSAPAPCYFQLGATEADVGIDPWHDFSASDLQAALGCAEWIIGQIKASVFWPPAEKVDYDDFADLCAGRNAGEMFLPVPHAIQA